jgi:hypothetical protein
MSYINQYWKSTICIQYDTTACQILVFMAMFEWLQTHVLLTSDHNVYVSLKAHWQQPIPWYGSGRPSTIFWSLLHGGGTSYPPMMFNSESNQSHGDQLYKENWVQLSKMLILLQPFQATLNQKHCLLDAHPMAIYSVFPCSCINIRSAEALLNHFDWNEHWTNFQSRRNTFIPLDALHPSNKRPPGGGLLHARSWYQASHCVFRSDCDTIAPARCILVTGSLQECLRGCGVQT